MTGDRGSVEESPRDKETSCREFRISIGAAVLVVSMVATLSAIVPMQILPLLLFGVQATTIGSSPEYLFALAGIFVLITLWMGVIDGVQARLIQRYSGMYQPAQLIDRWQPPYLRRYTNDRDEAVFSPLMNHPPGARLTRNQFARVIAVLPILSLLTIIVSIVSTYMLPIDYILAIGVAAAFGGTMSFFAHVLRVLRLPPSTEVELTSDAWRVIVCEDTL